MTKKIKLYIVDNLKYFIVSFFCVGFFVFVLPAAAANNIVGIFGGGSVQACQLRQSQISSSSNCPTLTLQVRVLNSSAGTFHGALKQLKQRGQPKPDIDVWIYAGQQYEIIPISFGSDEVGSWDLSMVDSGGQQVSAVKIITVTANPNAGSIDQSPASGAGGGTTQFHNGAPCTSNAQCFSGFCLNSGSNWVCQGRGVGGTPCDSNPDICQPGLSCVDSGNQKVCGVPGQSSPNPNNPNNPNTNPNTNPPAGGGSQCGGDANLVWQNGVCLPADQKCTTGICANSTLSGLLINVIKLLLGLAGIIAVVVLIVGGFWYITSAGNEEQAEKGKKAIINAVIGLVVVILAYAIVAIISNTLSM